MKKWVCILMIAAFVMATTMSSYSHAMPGDHTSKTKASEHADCHKKANIDKVAKHEKDDSGNSCCKKGVCKCANNGCHASVKVFGNSVTASLAPLSREGGIGFIQQHLTSASLEGIKRPPRA